MPLVETRTRPSLREEAARHPAEYVRYPSDMSEVLLWAWNQQVARNALQPRRVAEELVKLFTILDSAQQRA